MSSPIVIPVSDVSQAGEARRAASALAARHGFSEEAQGKVALVVTEAARNLAIHAKQGELVVTPIEAAGVGGVEILALDRGPGMTDVARCMADGYSTAGTAGEGLGAMARMSSTFDIFSLPGVGTALLARLWARPRPGGAQAGCLDLGAVSLPKSGEEACGDGYAIDQESGRCRIMVVDGLGHGPGAATAAQEAIRIFERSAGEGPVATLQAAHAGMRHTRGAAMAVAELNPETRQIRYAGIGNIVSSLISEKQRLNMVSLNGTVGHQVRQVQEFTYPWIEHALLVMHSDGLGTHWKLDSYPGLAAREPTLVAGVLYRDFSRGRDDVTVLVARELTGRTAA